MLPAAAERSIPPTAPAIPPIPVTDPTARRGNISEPRVNIFADHPWCAAVARPIKATATHISEALHAKMIGTTHRAQTSMVVLRAALMLHPRLISRDESQPPAMLPTSE